jgi:hypothetical protein
MFRDLADVSHRKGDHCKHGCDGINHPEARTEMSIGAV